MKILIGTKETANVSLVFKDGDLKDNEVYKYITEKDLFKGKEGEVWTTFSTDDNHNFILGLGDEEDLNLEVIRKSFYNLGKKLMELKVESVNIDLTLIKDINNEKMALAASEGLIQSEYSFEKYLSKKKTKPSLEEVYLNGDGLNDKEIQAGIDEAIIVTEGIFLARDLVNEPALVMTPTKLAEIAKSELEEVGVKVQVLGEKEIEDLNMEAFLAVSKGSSEEPKFIIMEWLNGSKEDHKTALVGKGLTFDSGGYSLKPSKGMETMHSDMAGSASVIGTMKAIAKSGLKKNVVAIVAACENMVSGHAYKPGDIIGSMSGKTIEAMNTDAEGRLTLADALYYAATVVKADRIVDIATLTGACVVALGDITSGAITNHEGLMEDVIESSFIAGEPVWELPNFKEYEKMVKGHNADLINTNSGGTGAGTITAGLFLKEFVEDTPWVHLDIAGTSFIDSSRGYLPKGATGVPVKTLFNLIKYN